MINVAFCVNDLALLGLGPTVSSLVRNCSDSSRLHLWFFCSNLSLAQRQRIGKLLGDENFNGDFDIVEFDPEATFKSLPPLHGDWTAYGRLLLSDYLHERTVLYLDADLIVEVDLLDLEQFDMQNTCLAVVPASAFKYQLDHNFYINIMGLSPDCPSFNSGVLLLNLDEWRLKNVKEMCLDLAKKHSSAYLSHDQSLLNALFAGNTSFLPKSFNCQWYAEKPKPTVADRMILHFVGSPKPWDPFGSFIHNGYRTWRGYLNKDWERSFNKFSVGIAKRAWQIRRSYVNRIIRKLKSKSVAFV